MKLWVRSGITRHCIITRRWAIKVPRLTGHRVAVVDGGSHVSADRLHWFCRGVLANHSEREWLGTKGLNPVVAHIGVVNVYRRALPVPPAYDFIDADGYEVDEALYDALTPDWVPTGDRKPSNVGVVNGEVVWIDYDMSWNGPRCDACEQDQVPLTAEIAGR